MKKLFLHLLLALIAVVGITACNPDKETVSVTKVTLDQFALTLRVGETQTFIAIVSPANASDKSVYWHSSHPDVATVDDNGKMRALTAGSTTITVTTVDEEIRAECKVTVRDPTLDPADAYFPDFNFRRALIKLGFIEENGDIDPSNSVNAQKLAQLTVLDLSEKNIFSLSGIEFFSVLEELNCRDNALAELDVSWNTALKILNCSINQLSALDVSGNIGLKSLNCAVNELTVLDVSSLIYLDLNNLICGRQQSALTLILTPEQKTVWDGLSKNAYYNTNITAVAQ